MCSDIKRLFKNLSTNIANSRTVVLICLAAYPIAVFLKTAIFSGKSIRYGIPLSMADCIVNSNTYYIGLILAPLSYFLLAFLSKNDEQTMFILRQQSKQVLWKLQFYKILLLSLFIILYKLFLNFSIGSFFSQSFINWAEYNSYYYNAIKSVNTGTTFASVLLTTAVCNFITILLTNLTALFINTATKSPVWGWIYMIVVGAWNCFGSRPMITGQLAISYETFKDPQKLPLGVLISLICIVMVFIAGKIIYKKKDFL